MGVSADSTRYSTENMAQFQYKNNGGHPEEGEIVDDFDDIISSDEEVSMRKRIAELEARNSELEQLANISGYYNNYDLGAPSDRYKSGHPAIDKILSGNFPRSVPNSYSKQRRLLPPLNNVERYKPHSPALFPPPPPSIPRKHIYSSPEAPQYSHRSYHSSRKRKYEKAKRNKSTHKKQRAKSRKKVRLDYCASSDEEVCALDRSKLRKAVRYEPVEVKVESIGPPSNPTSSTLPKINKSEDEVIIVNEKVDKQVESDDSESLEIQELRLIALKSAFLRKNRQRKQRKEIEQKTPYSPTDFLQPMPSLDPEISSPKEFMDMEISPIASPRSLEDGSRPVDMELVVSDDSSCPEFVESHSYWTPIHPIEEIPLPTSPRRTSPSLKNIISPIAVRSAAFLMPPKHVPFGAVNESDDEKVQIVSDEHGSPEQTDEEELALRALLLAQKNSPKVVKDTKTTSKPSEPLELNTEKHDPVDPLKVIYEIAQGPANKTAEILKEAVKRLQNKPSDNEHVKIQESTTTIPTITYSNSMQPKAAQYSKDVDYRRVYTSNITIVEHQEKPLQVTQLGIVRSIPPVNTQVKENVFSRGTRPNNIEIIPLKNIQRSANKPPLSDITETDNVAREKVKQIPKNLELNVKLGEETIESLEHVSVVVNKRNYSSDKMIAAEAIEKSISTKDEVQNLGIDSHHEDDELEETQLGNEYEELEETQLDKVPEQPKIDPPETTIEVKRQRKRSVTSLEVLQLKTQNLISSGKFVSRNKIVAAKLLNKAIHHNALAAKRKIVQKPKPVEDSRLIKSIDVPPVKPIIISINSKSESDSDDSLNDGFIAYNEETSAKQESDHNDLYDVASPMSLPMESPRDSPLTVPSCTSTTSTTTGNLIPAEKISGVKPAETAPLKTQNPVAVTNEPSKSAKKDGSFEAKLEEFLKNARSKVELCKKDTSEVVAKTPAAQKQQKMATTPAAVKHLPISSQLEYRRLISRMQMLEKQKLVKNQISTAPKEKENPLKVTIHNNLSPEKRPSEPIKIFAKSKNTANAIADPKTISIPSQSNPCVIRTVSTEKTVKIKSEKEVQVTVKNELAKNVQPITSAREEKTGDTTEPVKVPEKNVPAKVFENQIQKPVIAVPAKPKSLQISKKLPAKTPSKIPLQSKPSTTLQKAKALTTPGGVAQTTVKKLCQPLKPAAAKPIKAKPTPVKAGISKVKTVKTTPAKKLKIANVAKSIQGQNENPPTPAVAILPQLTETRTHLDCEKQYRESSCNLLDNISKTIKLVVAAQNEKREKLLLEHEQEQLRKRMQEIEKKIKDKHNAISDIYPKISSSHKLIVALKDRTTDLDKLSIDLSKRLGENRNNNFYMEQKNKIIILSKDLSLEIKKLKDISITDLNADKVVNNDATMPSIQDEAIQVNLIDRLNDSGTNESANCDTDTWVSSMTNLHNDQLVSGNFNNPDPISPSPSSSLNKQLSTNVTNDTRKKFVEAKNEEESFPSAKSDMKNVQSSLETVKDKKNPGGRTDSPNTNMSSTKDSNEAQEEKISPLLPRLYRRMCDTSDMESQSQKQSVGHKNDYVSPLTFSTEDTGSVNPLGILCPYQLMGQCDDKECRYEHLNK